MIWISFHSFVTFSISFTRFELVLDSFWFDYFLVDFIIIMILFFQFDLIWLFYLFLYVRMVDVNTGYG